ncbi:MAG: type II toxin-antitoxin system VapC family toxin [Chlorobium sp.]|jgi:PIN domain nuclease of toxin-antitoxin system|nr:type II toxin-antitoxin system VapC family toxin [Chlorobium sp.]
MLLLDTHVLIWLDEGNPRLGKIALQAIIESLGVGQLGVATISFWEVAMLIEKQRLTMQTELDVWRSELLQTGLLEIPLRGTTAIRAGQLKQFHGDSADRMIAATAIENGATLMTADEKILSWNQRLKKINARL